jgi:hypothetical protein
MLLRDHPLKSRQGVPNWPLVGTCIGELGNTHPKAFSSRQYLLVSNPSTGSFGLTSKIHLTPTVCCLMIMLCANRQQSTSFNLLQWFHPDVGLASSFPVVLRLLKKGRKAKGGKKTWKQNKK